MMACKRLRAAFQDAKDLYVDACSIKANHLSDLVDQTKMQVAVGSNVSHLSLTFTEKPSIGKLNVFFF